ncbi:MAG TPA: hypothetical protein VF072_08365 [Thermoleophilaceae bacterium]
MTTAFASEAAHIRDIGHLSAADIARATGADETTARAWLREERSPSGDRAERLFELSSLVERLVTVMQPEYVPVWLRKPNMQLEDDKPLDAIASGDYRRVSRVIAALETTPIS